MLTLVHFRLCPLSRSIRIALAELGIEAALVEERAFEGRPEFLAVNPAGELPVLQAPDGLVLCGALSIAEFIGEAASWRPSADVEGAHSGVDDRAAWPGRAAAGGLVRATVADRDRDEAGAMPPGATARMKTDLFPGDMEERAEVRRLVDWFHRKLDREVTRELLEEKVYARLLASGGGAPSPDVDVLRAVRANLRYHLRYVSFLADQRRWLAGGAFSFADIAGAAHLSVADYLGEIAWDEHPQAKAWYMRVKSRPSMRGVLADRLPGFPAAGHYAVLDF